MSSGYSIVLLLFLAHLIADFPLQADKMIEYRYSMEKTKSLLWNGFHAAIHLALSAALLINYQSLNTFFFIMILSALHFAIDLIKSFLVHMRPFIKYSIGYFVADQFFHVVSIITVSYCIYSERLAVPAYSALPQWFKHLQNPGVRFNHDQKIILACCLTVAGLWGAGMAIRVVFNYLKYRPYRRLINKGFIISEGSSYSIDMAPDISYWIGILERLLIICSIVVGIKEIIGFIFAVKSVARFKEFDDKSFVKSFIIGSFLSFITAIIIGVIINNLGIFPGLLDKDQ